MSSLNQARQHRRVIARKIMGEVPTDETPTDIIYIMQKNCEQQDLRVSEKDTEDYVTIALNLVKRSGAYALGSIASPMVSLVLAPFLTHSLSHADYGVLAVINTLIALAAGITQLGL